VSKFVILCSKVGKKKILVVDDNSEIRKLLVLYLGQLGYDTVEAATGHEAVDQARTTTPSLIIMDLAMPDGTGDEAIVSLKADPLTRDIPVIVLTGFLGGALIDRAIAAGATEIVHKPVNPKWLEVVLQRHLLVQQQTSSTNPFRRHGL
jgi:two-component system, cell cycle response regulator DivK